MQKLEIKEKKLVVLPDMSFWGFSGFFFDMGKEFGGIDLSLNWLPIFE